MYDTCVSLCRRKVPLFRPPDPAEEMSYGPGTRAFRIDFGQNRDRAVALRAPSGALGGALAPFCARLGHFRRNRVTRGLIRVRTLWYTSAGPWPTGSRGEHEGHLPYPMGRDGEVPLARVGRRGPDRVPLMLQAT
jgi:hypothetical protein